MNDEYETALRVAEARRLRDEIRERMQAANRELKQAEARGRTATKSRTWHVAALGNAFHVRGLQGGDALAVEGFFASKALRLQQRLEEAVRQNGDTSVGDVLMAAIAAHKEKLTAQGRQVIWQRNYEKYRTDKQSWIAAEVSTDWRRKRATKEQCWLILRTCEALDVPVPALSSRGAAFDWLAEHGANVRYQNPNENAGARENSNES